MDDKTLTQRLREQDWPEAADRIDALEAALRELDVMLHSAPLPGENPGPWNIKAKRIVHEALGEAHDG